MRVNEFSRIYLWTSRTIKPGLDVQIYMGRDKNVEKEF